MRTSNLRHLILSLTILALVGCQALRPGPLATPQGMSAATRVASTIEGRFDPGAPRAAQATTADLVASATVSFIDTATNATVATGKTNASGAFSLTLAGYAPAPGGTYLLEAIKGLNGQAPGAAAARFRTVLQWNGTAWLSCTNALPGGSIVINALTTALAVEAALDPLNVPAINTIGKVNNTTTPATLYATPGPYTGHPDAEITQLASDLTATLGMDADPMASVPSITPTVTSFTPGSAGEGSLVRILGTGFSPIPSGNTVTFNGTAATVLVASPTSLVVIVPAGVTGGTLRVQTGRGAANSAATFSPSGSSGGSGGGSGGGGSATSIGITSFSPTSGRVGDTITLRGAFGNATPSIVFTGASGSVQAPVTAWGPSTMIVTVPLSAMTGPISVGSGFETAQSVNAIQIRQGDLNLFTNVSTTGAGKGTPYTLPEGLQYAASVASGSFYYIVGGQLNSTATNLVRMYPVGSDGSLGTLRTVGTMQTARYQHAAAVVGNYLYALGGNGTTTSIEYARIYPDGSLGPFQTLGTTLSIGRYGFQAITIGDTIWALPGNGSNNYDAIQVDLGTGAYVSTRSGTLPVAGNGNFNGYDYGATVAGNTLILAAGNMASYYYNVVTFPITTSIATGTLYSNKLTSFHISGAACVVKDDQLYVMGGGTNVVERVAFTPATGVLGARSTDTAQAISTAYPVLLGTGNRIYCFGGGSNMGNIQTTTIQSDKTLSPWSLYGAGPTRIAYAAQTLGDKAWFIGGGPAANTYPPAGGTNLGASATTEYIKLSGDGRVTATVPGPNLQAARGGATAVTANGNLYVIGGTTGPSTGALRSVEWAKVNPDGTLGSFSTLTSILNSPRVFAASARLGNYLYVFGGFNNYAQTPMSSVERAMINADGTLGTFELLPTPSLPNVRGFFSATVVGDSIYLVGGSNSGGSETSEVLQARFDGDNLGTFRQAPPLVSGVFAPAVAQIGNYLYCFGGNNYYDNGTNTFTQTRNTIQRAVIYPDGTLSTWANAGTLPAAAGMFTGAPFLFGNWVLLMSGNTATTQWGTAMSQQLAIQQGYIQ